MTNECVVIDSIMADSFLVFCLFYSCTEYKQTRSCEVPQIHPTSIVVVVVVVHSIVVLLLVSPTVPLSFSTYSEL